MNKINNDPMLRKAAEIVKDAANGKVIKNGQVVSYDDAKAEYDKLYAELEQKQLTGHGIDPETYKRNLATPPGTPPARNQDGSINPGNPHMVASAQDIVKYVKVGQAYKGPDGVPHILTQDGLDKATKDAAGKSGAAKVAKTAKTAKTANEAPEAEPETETEDTE
jgi:hypothetical protein